MATNLFSQASAYRKKHPSVSQSEAVSICAERNRSGKPGKKKPAARKKAPAKKAVGRVKRKKAAARKPAAPRKVKVKIKANKKGGETIRIGKVKRKSAVKAVVRDVKKALGISGISHSKIGHELQHQHSLTASLNKHRAELRQKGLTPAEKTRIRREVDHYRSAIAASKKHVNALKRSL